MNDDEYGLHQDCEEWLERLAPHAPVSQYLHNRTVEACPKRIEGATPTRTSSRTQHAVLRVMGHEVLVAVTTGRLD